MLNPLLGRMSRLSSFEIVLHKLELSLLGHGYRVHDVKMRRRGEKTKQKASYPQLYAKIPFNYLIVGQTMGVSGLEELETDLR